MTKATLRFGVYALPIALFFSMPATYAEETAGSGDSDSAKSSNVYRDASMSSKWFKYLRYRSYGGGVFESEFKFRSMFFSEDGPADPVAEFRASVEKLKIDQTFKCVYPARLRVLESLVPSEFLDHFSEGTEHTPCPDLDRFRQSHQGSWFVGIKNPESIWGGLELKFQGNVSNKSSIFHFEIEEHSTDEVFFEIPKSLFGLYSSRFKEDFRADVKAETEQWFPLNLDDDQSSAMVDFVYEWLQFGGFQYFLLGENENYSVLSLLDNVSDGDLISKTGVILSAVDALQLIKNEGLISGGSEDSISVLDSHPAAQLKVGYFFQKSAQFRLGFRAAYHTFLDPGKGQSQEREFEFLKLDLAYLLNNHSIYLDRIDLLTVGAFPKWTSQNRPLSYEYSIGLRRPYDLNCTGCLLGPFARAGFGLTTDFVPKKLSFSVLPTIEIDFSSSFLHKYRIGFGPDWMLRWSIFDAFRILFVSELRYEPIRAEAGRFGFWGHRLAGQFDLSNRSGISFSVESPNSNFDFKESNAKMGLDFVHYF